ncbi:hypothetical protein B0O99DRAFT_693858 [Bisporella sp. PMI_857]|nr:hypothetical protein B0O99DRAFT_693858 [Bisporella sp. PMI_857]
MPLSQNPALLVVASAFGTITIGFGINAILNPLSGLSFFEIPPPADYATSPVLLNSLMTVYGARDILMGLMVYAGVYFREQKSLGTGLILGAVVAGVDGAVCKWIVGHGEWQHWGYAPVAAALGSVLLGWWD